MSRITSIAGWVFCALVSLHGAAAESDELSYKILDDPDRLEAFVSNIVTNRMQKGHVPGAVVTIVRGNRLIFNKGYGFANLADKRLVNPETTLFHIASVSKVFNAMAAMSLVDRGLIGLDEDVRPRLSAAGIALSDSIEGSVTLRGLLTHSAGIRELFIPNVTLNRDPSKVLPISLYLKKCLPLRWIPEGEAGLYSDHGITLSGYVTELISREQFQTFVRHSVMEPLGMKHSRYADPDKALEDLAVGYSYSGSGYQACEFYFTSIDPAIGVLTTGSDMARLIIAHLNSGTLFKPETMRMMHEAQYSDDPRLGYAATCGFFKLGFHEPSLLHHGAAMDFASQIAIIPDLNIGFFVSQNSETGLVFHLGDLHVLMGKTRGNAASEPKNPVERVIVGSNPEALAGSYVSTRTLSRGRPLQDEDYVRVRYVKESNTLQVEHSYNRGNPLSFIEAEREFFRAIGGEQQISFRKSADGKRIYLFDFSFTNEGQHMKVQETDPLGSAKNGAVSKGSK